MGARTAACASSTPGIGVDDWMVDRQGVVPERVGYGQGELQEESPLRGGAIRHQGTRSRSPVRFSLPSLSNWLTMRCTRLVIFEPVRLKPNRRHASLIASSPLIPKLSLTAWHRA